MAEEAEPTAAEAAREQTRILWTTAYEKWMENKDRLRTPFKSREDYKAIVAAIRKLSNGEIFTRDDKREINWSQRFERVEKDGKKVLFRSGKQVIREDKLFDLLYDLHERLGHAGRDNMFKELRTFDGVSKDLLAVFVKCCRNCELKKSKVKRGVVVRPILSEERNSRCQVDLIDYQSKPDGEYKFVLNYQDHLTKFVVLKALKTKSAAAVAKKLVGIFSLFGAPRILQSDNGREFANSVVTELISQWPECKIIHGKPRHSQSQGSVERANRDIGVRHY